MGWSGLEDLGQSCILLDSVEAMALTWNDDGPHGDTPSPTDAVPDTCALGVVHWIYYMRSNVSRDPRVDLHDD